jgi:hypothetical protein
MEGRGVGFGPNYGLRVAKGYLLGLKIWRH